MMNNAKKSTVTVYVVHVYAHVYVHVCIYMYMYNTILGRKGGVHGTLSYQITPSKLMYMYITIHV